MTLRPASLQVSQDLLGVSVVHTEPSSITRSGRIAQSKFTRLGSDTVFLLNHLPDLCQASRMLSGVPVMTRRNMRGEKNVKSEEGSAVIQFR